MSKRCVGLLLMVAAATALCLAQENSKVSSQLPASAAGPETKAVMSENAGNASVGPTFQQRYARYKLEFGDQFDVSFELSPEFNQTVTVQPDGYITLRLSPSIVRCPSASTDTASSQFRSTKFHMYASAF